MVIFYIAMLNNKMVFPTKDGGPYIELRIECSNHMIEKDDLFTRPSVGDPWVTDD